MNPLFLLNLISDLIKDDRPTPEQIKCTRVIVNNLIKEYNTVNTPIESLSDLDKEAQEAKKELM